MLLIFNERFPLSPFLLHCKHLSVDSLNSIEQEFDIKFGAKFGVKFGVNEMQLLLLLDERPGITAQDIAENIGISKRGVEKQLKKLKEIGTIYRQGSDKNGLWIINK